MNRSNLTKTFIDLFLLKTKPKNIPSNSILLFTLIIIIFVAKNIMQFGFAHAMKFRTHNGNFTLNLTLSESSFLVLISLLLSWACVYAVLCYYRQQKNTVQIMSAILGIEIIIIALTCVWLIIFRQFPQPLPKNSLASWSMVLSFVLLLYWQFIVYIYIFLNSVKISFLQAGMFSLIYMLLQNNVAELLLRLMIKK